MGLRDWYTYIDISQEILKDIYTQSTRYSSEECLSQAEIKPTTLEMNSPNSHCCIEPVKIKT